MPPSSHHGENTPLEDEEELLTFSDDIAPAAASTGVWNVLVVDDDEEVHQTTDLALRGVELLGRRIVLMHARNVGQSLDLLAGTDKIAVALIDVVMEEKDSGLQLVAKIRDAGRSDIRLVLRTGQPGSAPEFSVISRYDINDYRTKSELTRGKLLSVLTAALRSYSQITQIEESKAGLEMVVSATSDLFNRRNLALFSRGVLTQLAALIGVSPNGLVSVAVGSSSPDPHFPEMMVVSDAGDFSGSIGKRLEEISNHPLQVAFEAAASSNEPAVIDGHIAMYFRCPQGRKLFVYLDSGPSAGELDLSLLKIFATNIAITFENVDLVEKLDRLAFTDQTLGVPNINAFRAALDNLLVRKTPGLCVLKVFLNDVRLVSASFGAQFTDQALKAFYELLQRLLPEARMIARTSFSAFMVIADIGAISFGVLEEALARPISVGGVSVLMPSTLALVEVSVEMKNAEQIRQHAMATVLAARQEQRSTGVYSPAASEAMAERARLQAALHQALENGQGLYAALQPKIDLIRGEIIGTEALVRWQLGDRNIPPSVFIPIAEVSGLASAITRLMIRKVGEWASARRIRGLAVLPTAVNLSMFELQEEGFAASLMQIAAGAGLGPDSLEFEVTESGVMRYPARTIPGLKSLRDAGFRIAIDDFGAGYSSLGHLDRLPAQILKIDRSLIDRLRPETATTSVAALAVTLGGTLEMDVVAEGIETPAQHAALLRLQCRYGQGYLYGKPVAAQDFDGLYAGWTLDRALERAQAG
ncbi:EAL domain-containing protein [Radicibacter daui]|uniref:EAL domain-containing protein n=1 Tax=Radicibacter daui TaxID=3064829 RepID=UPI004046A860